MESENNVCTVYFPPFDYDLGLDRLYRVWRGMLNRCFNPHTKMYYRYGGRGITMCDEWRLDFFKFKEWAMATGYDYDAPRGQCTIDRIDNDGNYCPENCRWVTMAENARNRSRSGPIPKEKKPKEKKRKGPAPKLWEINGVSKTLKEWCIDYDMNYCTVANRLNRGMPLVEALTASTENPYRYRYCWRKKKATR